jgi:hypothetical protein
MDDRTFKGRRIVEEDPEQVSSLKPRPGHQLSTEADHVMCCRKSIELTLEFLLDETAIQENGNFIGQNVSEEKCSPITRGFRLL